MKNFPPNLVILVIVLILVGASVAIFLNRQKNPGIVSNSGNSLTPDTSESPTLAATAEYSATSSSDLEYIEQYNLEASSSAIPSPSPLSSYVYPGADVLINTPVKIELQSTNDAGAITEWYKEKIRQAGFNAKSFTQTITNGVILNKLSAAKPGEKIEVTIKKDQTQSNVAITVDRP